MEMRKIGRFDVSVVGLGCNNFGMACDQKQTSAVVSAAIEAGINFFDTADVYGNTQSEEFLGKALGKRREEVVVATKFGNIVHKEVDGEVRPVEGSGGGSSRWIKQACEDSLRRLGTDRIDLYQMHIPAGDVPIAETIEALDDLVKAGKILEVGCSNFSGEQIESSLEVSRTSGLAGWVSAQNHYSLLYRQIEDDAVPSVEKTRLALLPYFPLASGLLTGKYHRGEEPPADTRLGRVPPDRRKRWIGDDQFEKVEKLEAFAAESGHSLLELAISWLANQTSVASVIAGATKPGQVQANAASAGWVMSREELAAIDAITKV